MDEDGLIPLKPFIVRAMIEWCGANGLKPYMMLTVDREAVVPGEYVTDGKITLCVSSEAVHNADFGNESFDFDARFGERSMRLHIPVRAVTAVFPAEIPGKGLGFEYEPPAEPGPGPAEEDDAPFVIQKVK